MAIIWDKVTDTLFKMTNIKELICRYLREMAFIWDIDNVT